MSMVCSELYIVFDFRSKFRNRCNELLSAMSLKDMAQKLKQPTQTNGTNQKNKIRGYFSWIPLYPRDVLYRAWITMARLVGPDQIRQLCSPAGHGQPGPVPITLNIG